MRLRWRLAQFFEIRWWRFYLGNKNVEQYLFQKKIYWQKILSLCSSSISLSENDLMLDIGCGPSGIYILYPTKNMTAVDPLIKKYEQDLKHFKTAFYPNVTFIESTLEEFRTTCKFDYIFCMNAINHVSNIQTGFNVLSELLNSTGKLIITIDAHNHNWLKFLFRLTPGDVLHPHQYNIIEYNEFLNNAGLKIVQQVVLKKRFIFNHIMLIVVPV